MSAQRSRRDAQAYDIAPQAARINDALERVHDATGDLPHPRVTALVRAVRDMGARDPELLDAALAGRADPDALAEAARRQVRSRRDRAGLADMLSRSMDTDNGEPPFDHPYFDSDDSDDEEGGDSVDPDKAVLMARLKDWLDWHIADRDQRRRRNNTWQDLVYGGELDDVIEALTNRALSEEQAVIRILESAFGFDPHHDELFRADNASPEDLRTIADQVLHGKRVHLEPVLATRAARTRMANWIKDNHLGEFVRAATESMHAEQRDVLRNLGRPVPAPRDELAARIDRYGGPDRDRSMALLDSLPDYVRQSVLDSGPDDSVHSLLDQWSDGGTRVWGNPRARRALRDLAAGESHDLGSIISDPDRRRNAEQMVRQHPVPAFVRAAEGRFDEGAPGEGAVY